MSKKLLQAAAGNAGETLGYVEDVFSTYLYTGNTPQKYIPNGINLGNDPIGDVYLSGDNKTGYGVSGYTISTTGTVNIDTAVKHTGTGSYEFIGGTNNFLSWFDSTGLGSADFTIEFFARNLNQNGAGSLSIGSTSGQDYAGLTIAAAGTGGVYISTSGTSWQYGLLVSLNFPGIDDTWHHYAITRSGDTVRAFKDGVLQGTGTMSGSIAKKSGLVTLGKKSDSTTSIEGNIDEFRIIKGTALYVNDFTPPEQLHDFSASGEGGLVWIKHRNRTEGNALFDSERDINAMLSSDTTAAEYADTSNTFINSFNFDGFTIGNNSQVNYAASYNEPIASWTFRKAEKFFDVVTYTGDGVTGRTVSHNLNSTPGCIIVKNTTTSGFNWMVLHSSVGTPGSRIFLNLTDVYGPDSSLWNSTNPTSTEFTLGANPNVNSSGDTYVAYLFASDAGGFGDDGDESIIKCGSYIEPASGETEFTLGWEPQFILVKRIDAASDWQIFDIMRNMSHTESTPLRPNSSGAEFNFGNGYYKPMPTGFIVKSGAFGGGSSVIYIAIRRPMKTPESGTEVFAPIARTGTGATATVTGVGFAPDLSIVRNRNNYADSSTFFNDRLRGPLAYIRSASTSAEASNYTTQIQSFDMDGFTLGSDQINGGMNYSASATYINHFFRRAPGFFDVVAYTGNNAVGRAITHNLGVAPELIFIKIRNGGNNWAVYAAPEGNTKSGRLNEGLNFFSGVSTWNSTSPTSSVFTVSGTDSETNASIYNYIAYLFATLAGVSKVGSYTGTGADLNVDCGFSAGARFILIKRTDSTGDWYVYDSVRGIVAGNDPYLLLNSTAAEVTSTDYIDPLSSGFTVTSSAPAALNASEGTYIFLAIA